MDAEQDIDCSAIRWPPDEEDFNAEGFDEEDDSGAWESASGNRRFSDLRGFDAADIDDAADIEEAWLAGHPQDWADDASDALYDQLTEAFGGGIASLDVGLAAPVIALSAAGCVPVASCNGSAGHQYDCPTIAFFAPAHAVDTVLNTARATACGIGNATTGALVLYAEDIWCLLRFARALRGVLEEPGPGHDAP